VLEIFLTNTYHHQYSLYSNCNYCNTDCTQCGKAGQYACSNGIGNWNDGKFKFIDPLSAAEASNYYVTKVNVELNGNFGCAETAAGLTDMKVVVAGQLLEISRVITDGCMYTSSSSNT